jgi:hypothetical protein
MKKAPDRAGTLPNRTKFDSGKCLITGAGSGGPDLRQPDGSRVAAIRRRRPTCTKISRNPDNLRQKGHRMHAAAQDEHLSTGIMADFGDNAINRIVAFGAQS